ncbi:hypothetical protein [Streptomyces xanthophaeus]|uniref:hypothetical protein n=1 Tax=Streptomyces xanthophaeus TaxID=67385 RepID=UPI00233ECE37|nr:hypothetical protein [Streptomyces xanthophaeus]
MQQGTGRPNGRREVGVLAGPVGGMTAAQAAVVCVVMVLAAVMRLYGQLPMREIFQLLGGAAGIGVVVVFTFIPGGRGKVAAASRAAVAAFRASR